MIRTPVRSCWKVREKHQAVMAFDASVSSMSMRAIFYAWVWSTPAIQVPGPGGGSSQELLTDLVWRIIRL